MFYWWIKIGENKFYENWLVYIIVVHVILLKTDSSYLGN